MILRGSQLDLVAVVAHKVYGSSVVEVSYQSYEINYSKTLFKSGEVVKAQRTLVNGLCHTGSSSSRAPCRLHRHRVTKIKNTAAVAILPA